ncbi:hypothetical protein EW146_g1121 [Bondarzewia mesenterica]|uniref:tRNA-dihydrouridine(16/17) synthase [NAD(P)(+)] n=1 Tax=Bondarzewia mesenterica TaxID=1095465 RepID=A0A4S4M4U4_9AGAM|nr:hypothetical protein EW146_g1121 [Bondarzewia mesenterica]
MTVTPSLASTSSVPQTASRKLQGYEFYREVLGSPKYIVAPMVDQSELAWRRLSRRYGAELAYTPMINAKMFAGSHHKGYREQAFNTALGEEGGPGDRPLIVQFCANDPDKLLASARVLEPHCDAIDINLGCPQDIAKKGRYGSYLQDDWELIYKLINTLHLNLSIPVTAKFRVFPSVEKTVEYAKMLERAGAQILTCHGRTREQRGHNTGLADWAKIRAVKNAVSVPVFTNGNILYHRDIEQCLVETGADGVMSAEGQLYNAALFAPSLSTIPRLSSSTSHDPTSSSGDTGLHPPHARLALEYLQIVDSLKTPTPLSAVKGHLFKIMRPALAKEPDLREKMGRIRGGDGKGLKPYFEIVEEMVRRMDRDEKEAAESGECGDVEMIPHWLAQPYFRPLPAPATEVETEAAVKNKAISPGISKRPHSERTPDSDIDVEDDAKRTKLDIVAENSAPPAVVCG